MDNKKIILIAFLGATFFTCILILCFKGIKVNHGVNMGVGKQKISLPETDHVIEIERRNGKEPFRFHIKSPPKQIEIEKSN